MASPRFSLSLLTLACGTALTVHAQSTERITVTGRSVPAVSGFGAQPLASTPMQLGLFSASELADAGANSLAGLARIDAGISDAYNSEGYWSFLTVRGFVLDNRSNYRRDGLPINAETALALDNKERVEVLKGLSGVQAGVSAPGGLVNLVVKRPTVSLREVSLELQQGGTTKAAVDLSERFGDDQRFGLRLNAAMTDLKPQTRSTDGRSHLFVLAADAQLTPDSRLEAEFESSRQSQPSVPGFSLRGDQLPDAATVDPRINLNNQPWSLPVVLQGQTASLRWRQRVGGEGQLSAQLMSQRLRNDDRVAFPYGCYDAAVDVYWADRYCPDGSYDLYDFRSENERRNVDALDLQYSARHTVGRTRHDWSAGVANTRTQDRFQRQAYNYAGTGQDDGSAVTPAAPDLTDENTQRDERSTELYLRDAAWLSDRWSIWGGLRHTRLERRSVRTDGSRAVAYAQSFTTPWLGLSHQWNAQTLVYASWGQGVETDVAPNRSRYTNAGQALPALKSRQIEAGLKLGTDAAQASLSAFRIDRPLAADIGDCDVAGSCTRRIDGDARHQGLEAALDLRQGRWALQTSAMWLDATREGASDASLNGLKPTNVPRHALKARLSHDLAQWPGLQLQAALVHEGPRMVLPDNSIEAPGWTRLDLAARWTVKTAGATWTWRAGVDNLTDARAWRETPYQFGHAYLFPQSPRSWRVAMKTSF